MGFHQVPDALVNTVPEDSLIRSKRSGKFTFMVTQPSVFSSSPSNADSKEDFPAPTWPTTASKEPWGTVRSILERKDSILSLFKYTFWKENDQNSCYCFVAIKIHQLTPLLSYLRPQLHRVTLPVTLTFCSRTGAIPSKMPPTRKSSATSPSEFQTQTQDPGPLSGDRLDQSTAYKTFLSIRTFQHCFFSKTAMPFEITM